MKKILIITIGILFSLSVAAQTVPSTEVQIKEALMAAPATQKMGAMIYGYGQDGQLTMLRRGTNKLICLTDNPATGGFSAACYHSDLEPFMARGRALREEGKSNREIFDLREEEVRTGALLMPDQPTTLYVYDAPQEQFNPETGEVEGNLRYVVYVPYATGESSGLPTRPEIPGMPWLMDEGTHRAHIMITPQ